MEEKKKKSSFRRKTSAGRGSFYSVCLIVVIWNCAQTVTLERKTGGTGEGGVRAFRMIVQDGNRINLRL